MDLYSKEDFQRLMLSVLEPLKPYYSRERAELILGVTATNYDRKADGSLFTAFMGIGAFLGGRRRRNRI